MPRRGVPGHDRGRERLRLRCVRGRGLLQGRFAELPHGVAYYDAKRLANAHYDAERLANSFSLDGRNTVLNVHVVAVADADAIADVITDTVAHAHQNAERFSLGVVVDWCHSKPIDDSFILADQQPFNLELVVLVANAFCNANQDADAEHNVHGKLHGIAHGDTNSFAFDGRNTLLDVHGVAVADANAIRDANSNAERYANSLACARATLCANGCNRHVERCAGGHPSRKLQHLQR